MKQLKCFKNHGRYIRKHMYVKDLKFVLCLINSMRCSESLNIFQCVICCECCHIYVAVWSDSSMRNGLVFSCTVDGLRAI